MQPGKLWGLRRLADDYGRFAMLALDQRPPVEKLLAERRQRSDVSAADLAAFKAVLIHNLAPAASAVLVDPVVTYSRLVDDLDPHRGLLVSLDDAAFAADGLHDRGRVIDDWSVERIKRLGADGVKFLAWHRPDGNLEAQSHQQRLVEEIGDQCRHFDIPFVLELLLTPHSDGRLDAPLEHTELVIESVSVFSDPAFGIDLFQLQLPVLPADLSGAEVSDQAIDAFRRLDMAADRPWVQMSTGVGFDVFRQALKLACEAGASGFLGGRSIWWDAGRQFPNLWRMNTSLRTEGLNRIRELTEVGNEFAVPWMEKARAIGPPEVDSFGGEAWGESGLPLSH